MFRRGDPVRDDLLEIRGAHAGMGGRHGKPLLAELGQRLLVVFEHRLERLLLLPLRMIRRHRLDPVQRESELGIDRVLGPQGSVIVEGGDALGGRDEVVARLSRHRLDELDDRSLGRGVVPRRQRIALGDHRRGEGKRTDDAGGDQ